MKQFFARFGKFGLLLIIPLILVIIAVAFIGNNSLFGNPYFGSNCLRDNISRNFGLPISNGAEYSSCLSRRREDEAKKYQAKFTYDTGQTVEYASIKTFDKNQIGRNETFGMKVNKIATKVPQNYKNLKEEKDSDKDSMYVFVDTTVWNYSNLNYNSPVFYVKDSQGLKYQNQSLITSPQFTFSNFEQNSKRRGELVFEVKKDYQNLKLYMEITQEKFVYLVTDLGDKLEFESEVDKTWTWQKDIFEINQTKKIEPFEITILQSERKKFPNDFDKELEQSKKDGQTWFNRNKPKSVNPDDFSYDFNPKFDQIKVRAKFKNTSPYTLNFQNSAFLEDQTGRIINVGKVSSGVGKAIYGNIKPGEEIETEVYFDNVDPNQMEFRVNFSPSNEIKSSSIVANLGKI